MRKEFMEAFCLQNLKDLRNYTLPAISELKKQPETPSTRSDFNSKVRPQTHLVNILQDVSTDSTTGPRGEDCTNRYSSNDWPVTVTSAASSDPFNQGQCASKTLPLPYQSESTIGQPMQTLYAANTLVQPVLQTPLLLDAQICNVR